VIKKKFLIALLVFFSFSSLTQLKAEQLSDNDKASIKIVVEEQLKAFANDDFEKAYSYAAPLIKKIFASPEIFKNMVTTQYQAVYRPKKIDFGDVKIVRGAPTINVFLVDPDGNFVTATYLMQLQPDNNWLIAGCYLNTSNFDQT
tara:strand:- start:554 stop:988 length:435 start_codon:yes stop_codon:yes gene_type:complete